MTMERPKAMTPQEQRLLDAALALETQTERRDFLASIGDPARRQRLEQLLAASAGAATFFREPMLQRADENIPALAPTIETEGLAAEAPAQTLGRYKLLEKIGEGGFGEVWMADQREPVKRRVALKIIKLGMDSRQVVARFEAERQALAMMDHANIAKIFDAGTTENGRPYFVMELVRGIKITEYCDHSQLPTQERLKLTARARASVAFLVSWIWQLQLITPQDVFLLCLVEGGSDDTKKVPPYHPPTPCTHAGPESTSDVHCAKIMPNYGCHGRDFGS